MLRNEGRRIERLEVEPVLQLIGGRFSSWIKLEQPGEQSAVSEIRYEQHDGSRQHDKEKIHGNGESRGWLGLSKGLPQLPVVRFATTNASHWCPRHPAQALGYTKAYVIIGYFCNRVLCFAMPMIHARRYDTLRSVAIEIEAGRIKQISATEERGELPFVAPGLVDLQINGFGGIEFNDPQLTIEKVRQVAHLQDAFGVTAFLATCTTDAYDVLSHALATIAEAIRELPEVAARI